MPKHARRPGIPTAALRRGCRRWTIIIAAIEGLPVELGRYGATLEKLIADAVMAVFGTPVPRSKGRAA
jgi:hypothetical protein